MAFSAHGNGDLVNAPSGLLATRPASLPRTEIEHKYALRISVSCLTDLPPPLRVTFPQEGHLPLVSTHIVEVLPFFLKRVLDFLAPPHSRAPGKIFLQPVTHEPPPYDGTSFGPLVCWFVAPTGPPCGLLLLNSAASSQTVERERRLVSESTRPRPPWSTWLHAGCGRAPLLPGLVRSSSSKGLQSSSYQEEWFTLLWLLVLYGVSPFRGI